MNYWFACYWYNKTAKWISMQYLKWNELPTAAKYYENCFVFPMTGIAFFSIAWNDMNICFLLDWSLMPMLWVSSEWVWIDKWGRHLPSWTRCLASQYGWCVGRVLQISVNTRRKKKKNNYFRPKVNHLHVAIFLHQH